MTNSSRPTSEQVDLIRSANMRAVKGKDTKPELTVRRLLHSMGYRFRLHVGDLPGRPDIVLPRHKTVVFVHGCFWHRHEGCSRATLPKIRSQFWKAKFEANVSRDKNSRCELIDRGWKVITIWECQVKDADRLHELLSDALPRTTGGSLDASG